MVGTIKNRNIDWRSWETKNFPSKPKNHGITSLSGILNFLWEWKTWEDNKPAPG